MRNYSILALFVASICAPSIVGAEAPKFQTKSPVIYLADNLDEKDMLGWCIDTKGRGFSEILHAHSCKPSGGDVQFKFDNDTGQIQSVAFPDKCMEVTGASEKEPFGLLDCDANNGAQKFSFDIKSMQIRVASDENRCVTVGDAGRSAGPFMSRDLILKDCASAKPSHSQWMIKNGK